MTGIIAESELILNPNGSVYHLDLFPEEIAETIFLVGDPGRVATVSQHFDKIETKKQKREFIAHTGEKNSHRLTVLSTGIGTDNIDIVINELDALANIDFKTRQIRAVPKSLTLIRLGTSGALQEDIELDSLVASTHGLGFDCLMAFYDLPHTAEEQALLDAAKTHFSVAPPYYAASGEKALIEQFSAIARTGITATCAGFYGPQGRMLRSRPLDEHFIERMHRFRFQDKMITNFEMETSGIYGLGRLLGHRCCSLNTIVANRITQSFSKNPYAAINHMIETVLACLR